MIPASELARIQSDHVAAACDKTCVIQRASTSKDAYGSESETYSTIATTVCGMSEPSPSQLQNYDFRIGALSAWQVKLPYGTAVQERDHLIIEGNTLEVHVLLDPHSVPGLLTALAAEIR